MWVPIMTLPDGAEISMNRPSTAGDNDAPNYRVERQGKKIGEFNALNDIALFVRYRHSQATHDAFIRARERRLASSQVPGTGARLDPRNLAPAAATGHPDSLPRRPVQHAVRRPTSAGRPSRSAS